MLGEHQLAIISPATRNKEIFKWITCKPGEIKDENSEIVDVISWIVSDVKEMSENVILAKLLKETDRSSYDDVSKLCDVYNNAILDLWNMWMEANIVPEFFNRKASRDHIQFILLQCYNRAVSDPEKLNQYPPFSPQVYGETSFELISQMIDTITVASDDVFIDLGSGVGQVVLQVCACTDAKFCYGIEKADYPANCASRLDSAFRHWMSFYGKSYRPYALERGDFLSVEYQERITNASVLFANNFAFGPEVDHQLKQRFANLKEGARIISSKAFCPLNFRITDRNLGDIGSIMRVNCLTPIQDAVSWTDKPFSYYVHTIDRSLLEQYFARLKNPKFKDESQIVRRDRKGRVISEINMREGSSQSSSNSNGNNQRNINGNVSRKSRRSSTITKHSSFLCLPKRSASVPDIAASSSKLMVSTTSMGRRMPNLQNCLSRNEATSHCVVKGSTAIRRMKQHSRQQRRESRHWQSKLKRSLFHHKDNESSLDIFSSSNDNNNTSVVESHVNAQLSSLTLGSLVVCDGNEEAKQFHKVIQHLLDDPCENHLLSKTDKTKHSVLRKSKIISDNLASNYTLTDDCLSLHSSSSQDQRESRNSSSSPYVSSLSSANRSPNSQVDEVTPLNSLTNSETTIRPAQSPTISIVPDEKLDKDEHDDSFHIRIKFKMSNLIDIQNHPVGVESKPSSTDDNDSNRSKNLVNSIDGCDANVINKDHSNNVANRRIMRRCRQLLNDDSSLSNVTYSKNSNDRTIVLRKRMQKRLLNPVNHSKSPLVHPSSCETSSSSKLKHSRRSSRDELRYSMDILHDHTVTHVQSKPTPARFGLNDKRFSAYTCHYQPVNVYAESNEIRLNGPVPSDPHTGYNKSPIPFALTQYLEMTKQAFMDHFTMLRSPAYTSTIQSELERERSRQAELLKQTEFLEQSIAKLHTDGTELLNRFTKRLGILITTPAAFFAQARRLIKYHHVLEEKISEFRKQISQLSAANQELVKRHQIEAARLLAAATTNKPYNSFQNQHHTSNKLTSVTDDTTLTCQMKKRGFCYDSNNSFPYAPCSESNYVHTVSFNSMMIPPPPSLTKVSHNTATRNSISLHSVVTSDKLAFSHETCQQHPFNSLKSPKVKCKTSNSAHSVLHNNTNLHRVAPVLMRTISTSHHSTIPIHTVNNKADCDNNNNNNNNNTSNYCSINNRVNKQLSIPPPPPLLPMHTHSDFHLDDALLSGKSPTDHDRHNKQYMHNSSILSLPPEISRSFTTSTENFNLSKNHSNHHNKSMHASLQDLILDEFSRQTPISGSDNSDVTSDNNSHNIYSIPDDSHSCYYDNNADSIVHQYYHRYHHHNRDRYSHHNHYQKGPHPNYIDYSHQFNLPPRKRHWDSCSYNSTFDGNNHDEDSEPPKLSREARAQT
ncbi:hypothetical protein MN116_007929 [Schistosoma mekongi]|uniref:Histone-lysine N-methyltransferase, H3 lysine-79 specific n=1 Tax=Schistosoma mekongi TaxID=38744 RepID=A0AAE1Z727_SCHME|nr:hypothetical protein MN116_007929 [Schistosoma mekongi]